MTDEEYFYWLALVWANCDTPDCEYKVCTWASTSKCFKCMERLVGHAEMIQRYNDTHDITWEQAQVG